MGEVPRDRLPQLKSKAVPRGTTPTGPCPGRAQGLRAGVRGQGSCPPQAGPSEPGPHPLPLGATAQRLLVISQVGKLVG